MDMIMRETVYLNIEPIPGSDKGYRVAFPAPDHVTKDIAVTVDTFRSIFYADSDTSENKVMPFQCVRFSAEDVFDSVGLKGHPRHMCMVYVYNYYVENGVLFILLNIEKADYLKIKSVPLSK
jgi:hypothetical protein